MTAQRRVRKDFDPTAEYSVDVSGCSEEVKKEVQQAFFDASFLWRDGGKVYRHLNVDKYTNTRKYGATTAYLMYGMTTCGCNMTTKEFLDLVYEPENQGHVHSEEMAQYAEDAKTSKTPWELWQMKSVDGVWRGCEAHPVWVSSTAYRRKPKTHIVNGVEIPDLRIEPKEGDRFYLVDPTGGDFTYRYTHTGDDCDEVWVSRRLCYEPTEAGREAAILHSKIMLGMTEVQNL